MKLIADWRVPLTKRGARFFFRVFASRPPRQRSATASIGRHGHADERTLPCARQMLAERAFGQLVSVMRGFTSELGAVELAAQDRSCRGRPRDGDRGATP
jgi:hypothetical protein